jgi:hypothetical protein
MKDWMVLHYENMKTPFSARHIDTRTDSNHDHIIY